MSQDETFYVLVSIERSGGRELAQFCLPGWAGYTTSPWAAGLFTADEVKARRDRHRYRCLPYEEAMGRLREYLSAEVIDERGCEL